MAADDEVIGGVAIEVRGDFSGLAADFDAAASQAVGLAGKFGSAIADAIGAGIGGLVFKQLASSGALDGLSASIGAAVSSGLGKIDFSGAAASVRSALGNALSGASGVFTDLEAEASGAFANVGTAFSGMASTVSGAASEAGAALGGLGQAATAAAASAVGAASSVADEATTAGATAAEAGGGFAKFWAGVGDAAGMSAGELALGAIAIGAGAAALAMTSLIEATNAEITAQAILASQTGTTWQDIATFQGADTSLGSGNTLTGLFSGGGLQAALDQMSQLAQGSDSVGQALAGVFANNATANGIEAVVAGFQALPDPIDRANLAVQLFGQNAGQALALMNAQTVTAVNNANDLAGAWDQATRESLQRITDLANTDLLAGLIPNWSNDWAQLKQIAVLSATGIEDTYHTFFVQLGADWHDAIQLINQQIAANGIVLPAPDVPSLSNAQLQQYIKSYLGGANTPGGPLSVPSASTAVGLADPAVVAQAQALITENNNAAQTYEQLTANVSTFTVTLAKLQDQWNIDPGNAVLAQAIVNTQALIEKDQSLLDKTDALEQAVKDLATAYLLLGVQDPAKQVADLNTALQAFARLAANLPLPDVEIAATNLQNRLQSALQAGVIGADAFEKGLNLINGTLDDLDAKLGQSELATKGFSLLDIGGFTTDAAAIQGLYNIVSGLNMAAQAQRDYTNAQQDAANGFNFNAGLKSQNDLLAQQDLDLASLSGDLVLLQKAATDADAAMFALVSQVPGAQQISAWQQVSDAINAAQIKPPNWSVIQSQSDAYFAEFQANMTQMNSSWSLTAQVAQAAIDRIDTSLGTDLSNALVNIISGTKSVSVAFATMGEQISKTVLQTIIQGALSPLLNQLDSLLSKAPLIGSLFATPGTLAQKIASTPSNAAGGAGAYAPGAMGSTGEGGIYGPQGAGGDVEGSGGGYAGSVGTEYTSIGIAATQALMGAVVSNTTAVVANSSAIAAQTVSTEANIAMGNVVQGAFAAIPEAIPAALTPALSETFTPLLEGVAGNTVALAAGTIGTEAETAAVVADTAAVGADAVAAAAETTADTADAAAETADTAAEVANTAALAASTAADAASSAASVAGSAAGGIGSALGSISDALGGIGGIVGIGVSVASGIVQGDELAQLNNKTWLIVSSSQGALNQLISLQTSANLYWPQLNHLPDIWGQIVTMQNILDQDLRADGFVSGTGGSSVSGGGPSGGQVVSDNTDAVNRSTQVASDVSGHLGDLKGPITALSTSNRQRLNAPYSPSAAQLGSVGSAGITDALSAQGAAQLIAMLIPTGNQGLPPSITAMLGGAGAARGTAITAGVTQTPFYSSQYDQLVTQSVNQPTQGNMIPAGMAFLTPASLATALMPTFAQLTGQLQNLNDGLSRPINVTVNTVNPLQAFAAGVRQVGVKS